MTKPRISIVVAITGQRAAIGNGNRLLVRISDDMKRFKALTLGHPLIMGRKTFESIGRPLPERTNIIVTKQPGFQAEGVLVASSLEEAIDKASELDSEVFIGGGGEIYKQALPLTDRLFLTIVDSEVEGDIFFPDYSDFKTVIKKEARHDEQTGLNYTWIDLER